MELITQRVPWKPLVLAPLGDIQWSGDRHEIAWDQLKRHLDEALKQDAWFIGMGDYIDFMSPSNRTRLKGAAFYDRTRQTIEAKARELTQQLYRDVLKPTTGRWLGLLEGHHFTQYESGMTSDMELAELLQTRLLGSQALVELRFVRGTSTKSVQVWAWHGHGGGQTIHAPLLKLAALARDWEDVDVFLVGHMTKIATAPQPRVRANFHARPPRLDHRDMRFVGTGGWLKGLVEHSRDGQIPRGGYVEQKGLNLVTLGAPVIRITPAMRAVDGRADVWAPDITAIA
jgi:hypothetical protein